MLKSLLLPVETSGLYFQDYSVLNAERLHISFAGKPIWGSSKTEKLQGFPNKSALQKKKSPKAAQAPKSKQPTWEKGRALEPGTSPTVWAGHGAASAAGTSGKWHSYLLLSSARVSQDSDM